MGGEALCRLKRLIGLGTEPAGSYRCHSCGADFEVQHHVCPECGGFSIEARAV